MSPVLNDCRNSIKFKKNCGNLLKMKWLLKCFTKFDEGYENIVVKLSVILIFRFKCLVLEKNNIKHIFISLLFSVIVEQITLLSE